MDSDLIDPAALVVTLERHHGVHARNASCLIEAIASRYQIGIVCWTADDLSKAVAAHSDDGVWQLSDAELDRARATRAWRRIGETLTAGRAIHRGLGEVLCEAGLVCTDCHTPIHGEPADTLAHCGPCRTHIGAEVIRQRGCPAKGYRRHRTETLATHGPGPKSRQAFCWDCGLPLYGVPVCRSCCDDDAKKTPQISRTCHCRLWQPITQMTVRPRAPHMSSRGTTNDEGVDQ